METTLNIESIPKTDSIEELAKFWDSHDVTDLADALEAVVSIGGAQATRSTTSNPAT